MLYEDLPELFQNDDICSALNGHVCAKYNHSLALTCGLVIKLRCSVNLLYKRSQYKFPRNRENKPAQLFSLVSLFTRDVDDLYDAWTEQTLWNVAEELSVKSLYLSVPLQKELSAHRLYPLDPSSRSIRFTHSFLTKVEAYHGIVRRPEGTFDVEVLPNLATIKELCSLPRFACHSCNGCRQIYCGSCGGLRMENSSLLLPERIDLPFDMLLLLHWQESLQKCTGIHAAALCREGQVEYWNWLKPEEEWKAIVERLDASRDVLLFPYPSSIPADEFPWTGRTLQSENSANLVSKWRLVVLEASWTYGKTMANQIVDYRKAKGLPPLRTIILTNITGQYWRFQSEGHSAVSTIEAIAHAAVAANLNRSSFEDLLLLFYVQKYRVIQRMNEKEGARKPRAIEVTGAGIGSWKNVSELPDEITMQALSLE